MHSKAWSSLSVLAILALLLATGVAPAYAAENITFLGATFISGKGLLFTFGLPDGYDASGAEGSVFVDGESYELECSMNETGHLVCLAGVSQKKIGSTATVSIDGNSFSALLKEPRPHCYSVFDFGGIGSPPWGPIGTNCQVHAAGIGQTIPFFNPNYPTIPFWQYIYGEDSSIFNPVCGPAVPELGNGYYYDC